MAIKSVVSARIQLDLFGIVVRVQTVKKKVVGTNLDTNMWLYCIRFLFKFYFHLISKLNHLNSEIFCGKKFRYI